MSCVIKMLSNSERKKIIFKRLRQSITQIDWEKMLVEVNNLQEDVNNHKSGVLLWAEQTYPNYMLLISALFGGIFENLLSSFLPEMKRVVDEYFTFHYDVKARNSKLYQEEISESNKLVFEKNVQPMDILVTKDAFIKNFNRKLAEVLKTYSTKVHDYSEKVEPIFFSFAEQMKDFLEKKENVNFNTEIIFGIENTSSISDALRQLRKLPKDLLKLRKIIKKTNKKRKQIEKETLLNIPKVDNELKNLTDDFVEVFSNDGTLWAYLRLLQIKEVDSFHIHFTKFIARLFHILSFNNRNYPDYIKKQHHKKTRRELKDFFEYKMSQKYPKLSNYLRSTFNHNKYRIIEAHHTPRVRFSNGNAYFSIPGTKKEIKMNFKYIKSIINTYNYFIEALGLPKPYQ